MGEAACYAHMLDEQGRMLDPPRVRVQHVAEGGEPDPFEIRVLVDRAFPRHVDKQALALDGWVRQLAPSSQLRRWFAYDPRKWLEFQRRYWRELCMEEPDES